MTFNPRTPPPPPERTLLELNYAFEIPKNFFYHSNTTAAQNNQTSAYHFLIPFTNTNSDTTVAQNNQTSAYHFHIPLTNTTLKQSKKTRIPV